MKSYLKYANATVFHHLFHLGSARENNIEQIQMTMVLRVSSTFLVVALMYLVMETPEKLKNAIERRVRLR